MLFRSLSERNARRAEDDPVIVGKQSFDELVERACWDTNLVPLLDTVRDCGVFAQRFAIFISPTVVKDPSTGKIYLADVLLCGSRRVSVINAAFQALGEQGKKL